MLPLDVLLEVLSCLEPREIGRAAAISRAYHKADRTPLLWFHVYSRLFRHHLPAPPRFRDILRGAATALPINAFDWRTLTIRRAVIDADRFHLVTVGALFRDDGLGLRDDYCISGPELETMCDIARTVDGVYGERMLGGGDKGAAGAIVRADAVEALKAAVARAYPLAHPFYKCAVHEVRVTTGVATFEGEL